MTTLNDVQIPLVSGIAFMIPMVELRNTPNVQFHEIPGLSSHIDAIDRVQHAPGAFSPSIQGMPDFRPWYMHPDQEDNLLVMHGLRMVELYSVAHGKIETFEVTPDYIKHNGVMVHEGPAIFGWYQHVFHRVHSPNGSLSLNFAVHDKGFDLRSNFNIYDVNTETGEYIVARDGYLDQPAMDVAE